MCAGWIFFQVVLLLSRHMDDARRTQKMHVLVSAENMLARSLFVDGPSGWIVDAGGGGSFDRAIRHEL